MSFVSTGKHKIIAENCCIVFDPSSGEIVHVYRIRTIEGAEVRSQEAIAERALELAKKHGATADTLDFIHVDPTVLTERGRFKVHTRSRTLVAAESQPKRATKKAKKPVRMGSQTADRGPRLRKRTRVKTKKAKKRN